MDLEPTSKMALQNHDSPRPPLPDWIQEVYEQVVSLIDANSTDGLARDDAITALSADESLGIPREDATYAFDTLLNRGWLYEVDGELRVTDPDREVSPR